MSIQPAKLKNKKRSLFDSELEELTHIVALTSYEGKEIVQECLNIGMKKVIHKPITS